MRVRRCAAVVVAVVVVAGAFVVGRTTAGGDDTHDPMMPSAVDIGFSQDMAVHHEQALLMANLAMDRARPAVRALADAILVNQSQEIGLMRGWLRLWHAPAAAPTPMAWMSSGSMPSMPGMSGMGGHGLPPGSTAMPGMAGPGQLDRLDRLTGKKFDVLFLQLMIRHHEGGIEMAHDAVRHAALPVVRTAARSMIVEQVEDIGTMRALLHADGAKELPAPR